MQKTTVGFPMKICFLQETMTNKEMRSQISRNAKCIFSELFTRSLESSTKVFISMDTHWLFCHAPTWCMTNKWAIFRAKDSDHEEWELMISLLVGKSFDLWVDRESPYRLRTHYNYLTFNSILSILFFSKTSQFPSIAIQIRWMINI